MENVIKIDGGLGNQMFQYALLIMMRSRGTIVYADNTELLSRGNQHQGYELRKAFNINETMPSFIRLKYKVLYWLAYNGICRRLFRFGDQCFYSEDREHHNYTENVFNRDNCYLIGYWQSEKFFHDAEELVRSKFSFVPDNDVRNLACKNMMKLTNSVSLHIRRGDYLQPDVFKTFGGICTESYYKNAMNLIEASVGDVQYFVFTNDPSYVKSSDIFREKNYTLIDWNLGVNSFRDMELMSCCKHNIIANSTFSWWGAWLNANTNKKVIAPSRWSNRDNDFVDIVPDDWIRIDVDAQ